MIIMSNILYSLVLAFCFVAIQFASAEPLPSSDNVCNKTITIKKEATVGETVKYDVPYQGICQGIYACTKYRTETRTDYRLRPISKEVIIPTCCSGYAETPDRKCAPICLNSCKFGKCVAPNMCRCSNEPTVSSPGYVGSTCDRYVCLATDRWGSNCERTCDACPPNSYCSASSGKCICRAGWRGANCTEECEPSMNCENVDLPPIIDPEANIIHVSSHEQSQRLEAGRSFEAVYEDEKRVNWLPIHMGINLFLLLVSSMVIFALFWYRRRLTQVRNELYYGPASQGSDSNYSPDSVYSNNHQGMQNRPRMPTPQTGPVDFLGKNLSFAAATRGIINGKLDAQANEESNSREKFIFHPRVESHLIKSQKAAEQNLYSDIEANFGDKSYQVESNSTLPNPATLNISLNTTSEEHDYQVPRVQATRAPFTPAVDDTTFDDDGSNIYEEIKPRQPKQQ